MSHVMSPGDPDETRSKAPLVFPPVSFKDIILNRLRIQVNFILIGLGLILNSVNWFAICSICELQLAFVQIQPGIQCVSRLCHVEGKYFKYSRYKEVQFNVLFIKVRNTAYYTT